MSTPQPQTLKIVLVGDGTVGKTCMLSAYTTGKFPYEYVPTVVENTMHDESVDNHTVKLHLWDTAGQEDYDRLRPLSYPDTAVFLLCFAVNVRTSYKNVRDKWFPELRNYCPNALIVLVATKVDLRTDRNTLEQLAKQNSAIVSTDEGQAMAKDIGAVRYVECSALQQQGLDNVFKETVRAYFASKGGTKKKKRDGRKKDCSLL